MCRDESRDVGVLKGRGKNRQTRPRPTQTLQLTWRGKRVRIHIRGSSLSLSLYLSLAYPQPPLLFIGLLYGLLLFLLLTSFGSFCQSFLLFFYSFCTCLLSTL